MTILRDERTPRSEFIFYTDRLATLIVEHALNFLPHQHKEIRTPTGVQHVGMGNCEEVRDLGQLWRSQLEAHPSPSSVSRSCALADHSHTVSAASSVMCRWAAC